MTVDEVSATIKTFLECDLRPFFVSGGNGLEIVVAVGAMHSLILHIYASFLHESFLRSIVLVSSETRLSAYSGKNPASGGDQAFCPA